MNTSGRFVAPEAVASHFHIKPGDQVADFGAGSGFFLPALSARAGKSGRVYACEIQRPLVDAIAEKSRTENWFNVQVLWCDLEHAEGVAIPEGSLDVGVLVNTLFLLEDKKTAVSEIARVLRTGGNLFVIDWTESFKGLGPRPDDVVDAAIATALFEQNGFVLEREFDAGEHHYGLAFKKI